MEVSITKFRHDLFDFVNQAMEGGEIWVVHKGQRLKLVPEKPAGSKLDRITPLQVVSPGVTTLDDLELKEEMEQALAEDWKTL